MTKKRFTAEQIIMKLREAEVVLAQGKPPETMASLGHRRSCATAPLCNPGSRWPPGRDLLESVGVRILFIEPGSPWENGYVESFNEKLRDELLITTNLPGAHLKGVKLFHKPYD